MKRLIPLGGVVIVAALVGTWWMTGPGNSKQKPHRLTFTKSGPMVAHANPSTIEHLLPAPTGPVPDGQRVLVVTWDTVRSDHTSAYGYPRDTTPTLAALAKRGVRFADNVVPQSTTLPTHVSLFTGTHPEEHGVIGNSAGGEYAFVPPPSLPTLARHLGEHGYLTAAFVSSAPLKKYSGISDGFQVWSEPAIRSRAALATTVRAIEWLDEVDEDRPFLLWVHVYDPHAPYRATKAAQGTLGDHDFSAELGAQALPTEQFTLTKLNRWREQYDLEIRGIDDQLAVLLEAVEERFPDTVITVAGDHGEGLGQHGHREHGLTWPEQILSPWVMAAPGLAPRVVKEPTTSSDFLPTLAGIATLPAEEALLKWSSGLDALKPIPPDRAILSRTSPRQLQKLKKTADVDRMSWTLTSTRWHFVWTPGEPAQLFDRVADPHSLSDVSAQHPTLITSFTKQVHDQRDRMHSTAEKLGSGRTKALKAETAAELKALGYLD